MRTGLKDGAYGRGSETFETSEPIETFETFKAFETFELFGAFEPVEPPELALGGPLSIPDAIAFGRCTAGMPGAKPPGA